MLLNATVSIAGRLTIITSVRKPGGAPDVSLVNKKCFSRLSIRDDFIEDIFPSMAVASAEDCLVIATPETPKWDSVRIYDAFTLLHDSKKIMYLRIPCMDEWHGVEFKESLLALLELAENVLKCDYLYVCLEKTRSDLANLVHAFLYVGFNVVPSPVNGCNTKYVFLAYGLK